MAATLLVDGKLREIWQEVGQAGGASQVFTTGIRIDPGSLSRVRALLVIDSTNGAVNPVVTADAPNGFLRFSVGFGGNPALLTAWTLDAQLTHSIQQARDPSAGAYIAVVFGAGDDAQTLAQTYDAGLTQDDQTMLISTAKGGGVIVEASTAVVTADGVSLNVRQSSAWSVPVLIERSGDIAPGPNVQFRKSRGSFAVPAQIALNDVLGTFDFYGYTAGAFFQASRIYNWASAVAAGPGFELSTALDFEVSAVGVRAAVFRMQRLGAAGGGNLLCIGDGMIQPDVDNQGSLGHPVSGNAWARVTAYNSYALTNMFVGGYSGGAGANHTIVLINDSVLPAPTSNQVYIGAQDFVGGTNLATLAVSAEEPDIATVPIEASRLIPFRYNGVSFYLLAVGAVGG